MPTHTTKEEREHLRSKLMRMGARDITHYEMGINADVLHRLLKDADIAEELDKGRCVATTVAGSRCSNLPMVNAPVCGQHWDAVKWANSKGPKK